jgi:hypothetical protein
LVSNVGRELATSWLIDQLDESACGANSGQRIMKPKYTGDALQSPRCAVGELGGEVNIQALNIDYLCPVQNNGRHSHLREQNRERDVNECCEKRDVCELVSRHIRR